MKQGPALDMLNRYNVNVDDTAQIVWQPLYDYQDYASGGASEFIFFQNPKGQSGKTLEDTNMTSAGQLASPQEMLVTSMEIFFKSGADVAQQDAFGSVNPQAEDLNAILGRGHIQIFIGNKPYLDEVGIEQFPCGVALMSEATITDQTTTAADLFSVVNTASFRGRKYQFEPFRLPPNQNFQVTVNFPNGAVSMPSGEDARIGVRLNGWQYRLAQ